MALPYISSNQRYLITQGGTATDRLPVLAADFNPMVTQVNDLIDGSISTTTLALSGTTASTSTVTGTLTVAGGAGVAGALFVSTTTPASISNTGVLSVTNATDATTSTTGSVKITGGVGIAKALYVGTSVNATTYVTSGNGTVSLPAIGPVSDPDSGLYVIGANNLGVACAGAKVLDIATTGLGVTGVLTSSGKLTTAAHVVKPTTTTVAANSGTTLTAAMMLSGYVEVTGTTGSLALDTIANITTALGHTPVAGESFEFIINTKGATPMTAGNVVTLTVSASSIFMKQFNTTDVGTDFIPTVTATDGIHIGVFRYVFQTATTSVVQRIG